MTSNSQVARRMIFLNHYLKSFLFLLALSLIHGNHTVMAASEITDNGLHQVVNNELGDTSLVNDYFDTQIWLSDMSQRLSNRIKDQQARVELLTTIHREAARAQLPPELVLAIIEIESNFDPWAISKTGAIGLMQVKPFWLNELGKPSDNLHHVQTNLRIGCTILRHYINLEKGDITHALARYNGSYGRREYADKVLGALSKRWYRQ